MQQATAAVIRPKTPECPVAIDSTRTYFGCCCVSGAGAAFYIVIPLVLSLLASQRGWPEGMVGDAGAAYSVGFATASVSTTAWLRTLGWRPASRLAAVLSAGALGALALTRGFGAAIAMLSIIGFATGVLYSIPIDVLGGSRIPDRAFGIKLAGEMLPGSIIVYLLPVVVIPRFGLQGLILAVAALILVFGWMAFLIPARPPLAARTEGAPPGSRKSASYPAILSILATFLFYSALAGPFQLAGLLAARRSLALNIVGIASSIGGIASICGGVVAGILADRYGRVVPVFLGSAIVWIGLVILGTFMTGFAFCASIVVLTLIANFLLAYTMGLTATLDRGGILVPLSAAAIGAGGVAGSGLGGYIVQALGFGALLMLSALTILVALLIYCHATKFVRHT